MLSKKLVMILALATLIVSALVTDGEAAGARKVEQKGKLVLLKKSQFMKYRKNIK